MISDIFVLGLCVVFCGINLGKFFVYIGFYFVYSGNCFWKVIYQVGFIDWQFRLEEELQLLDMCCGIIMLVECLMVQVSEVVLQELCSGGCELVWKIEEYQLQVLVVFGKQVFELVFNQCGVKWGKQVMIIGMIQVWVLFNFSGLNWVMFDKLVVVYCELDDVLVICGQQWREVIFFGWLFECYKKSFLQGVF